MSDKAERKHWRDFLLSDEIDRLNEAERRFSENPTEANHTTLAVLKRELMAKGYGRAPFDGELRYPLMPGVYNTVKIGRAEWEKIRRVDYDTDVRIEELATLQRLFTLRLGGVCPDFIRRVLDERRNVLEENRERVTELNDRREADGSQDQA